MFYNQITLFISQLHSSALQGHQVVFMNYICHYWIIKIKAFFTFTGVDVSKIKLKFKMFVINVKNWVILIIQ